MGQADGGSKAGLVWAFEEVLFCSVRATSVERERRTTCHANVQDEMLVARFDALASVHKRDVRKVNAVCRHSLITYVLKEATPCSLSVDAQEGQ